MEQTKAPHEIAQAYRDVFLYTPQGKAILIDLIRVSGLLNIAGLRESGDLQHMVGSQDMVRRILSIIAVDEEKLLNLAIGESDE